MSLSQAVFKVHLFLRHIYVQPYVYESDSQVVKLDTRYFQPFYRRLRFFINFILLFSFHACFFRILWLFYHWKTYTMHNLDQGVCYMLIICALGLIISLLYMQTTEYIGLIYIVNQVHKLTQACGLKTTERQLRIPRIGNITDRAIFIYGLSAAFFTFPPAFVFIPLAIDWCPIQLVLKSNHILLKLVEGAIYGALMFSAEVPFLSVLIVLMSFLEGIYYFTLPFVQLKHDEHHRFRASFKNFVQAVLLVKKTNEVYETFLATLIFVGVLLASCSAYAVLRMYAMLNIFTYLGAISILMVCFVIALALTYLANLPRKNLVNFKLNFMGIKLTRKDRKTVTACQSSGFSVGPYGIATSKLGLCICDDIVHNTVTLLLLA